MTKREFCKVLGIGASVTLGGPVTAWADKIRILGSGGDPEPALAGGQTSPEFRRFLTGVRVGARRSHGALNVFWLHGAPAAAPLAVATLEEARGRGELVIAERDRAAVPSLVVENRGKRHVLCLAGEILLGGKQNRVVTEDILLPPLSGPVDLQVYCVEQGRWSVDARSGGGTSFGAQGTFAAPQLRAKVMERKGQAEVWREVDRYSARAAAPSATSSYQAVYDKPEVKAHQQETERAIDTRSAPGALGAAVFVGASFAGLDLFQDAGLFAREWPKLLRAHALETYDRPGSSDTDERALRTRVEDLLKKSGTAEGRLRRNAGVGRLFEFRVEPARGSALVAEGQVVHAAVL